jgi:integrase
MKEISINDFVFTGEKSKRALSDMTMTRAKNDIGGKGFTIHGFRSAFRDWAAEETNFQREVIETAIAHAVGDETERAYRRGDALEKRRKLMNAWAEYCGKNG